MKHAKTFVAMLITVFLASGCPVPGNQGGTGTVDHGKKPVEETKPITPPKLEWENGSPFVPTTELTTCQIGSTVLRIFQPDNHVTAPNQYYHSPLLNLRYINKNRAPRPPTEMDLVNDNLDLDAACKQKICDARGMGSNCTVVLSPLPVSFIEVGPQEGHASNDAYKSRWRKQFKTNQIISGNYRVTLQRYTKVDDVQYCPLPMTIEYRFKAFKGSVPPQLVLDLRSVVNSQEFQRLSQKVSVGVGTQPTLVTPYQIQKLVTSQVTQLSKYTINMYDENGHSSQFIRDAESKLTQGMENILDANFKVTLETVKRMSREMVSPTDLQKVRDTINSTVNRINSATSSSEQRTILSQKESWDFFSVVAKGALEYLGLKDQPTKWTDQEWRKFVNHTSSTFNWQHDGTSENTWRIRAINLMQLSTQSHVIAQSVHEAKFTLDGLSYNETTHAINLECKGMPNDGYCDADEKQGEGEKCGADCGCCWNKSNNVRQTYKQLFPVNSGNGYGCAVRGAQFCVSHPNGIIFRMGYTCHQNCALSFHPNPGNPGARYYADVIPQGRCFTWRRRWCSSNISETYDADYYVDTPQSSRYCDPRP